MPKRYFDDVILPRGRPWAAGRHATTSQGDPVVPRIPGSPPAELAPASGPVLNWIVNPNHISGGPFRFRGVSAAELIRRTVPYRVPRQLSDVPGTSYQSVCPNLPSHMNAVGSIMVSAVTGGKDVTFNGSGFLAAPYLAVTASHAIPWSVLAAMDGVVGAKIPTITFRPGYCPTQPTCSNPPALDDWFAIGSIVEVPNAVLDGPTADKWGDQIGHHGAMDWATIIFVPKAGFAKPTSYFATHSFRPLIDDHLRWETAGYPMTSPSTGLGRVSRSSCPVWEPMVRQQGRRVTLHQAVLYSPWTNQSFKDAILQECGQQCGQMNPLGYIVLSDMGLESIFDELGNPPDVSGCIYPETDNCLALNYSLACNADATAGHSGGPVYRNFGDAARPDFRVVGVIAQAPPAGMTVAGGPYFHAVISEMKTNQFLAQLIW